MGIENNEVVLATTWRDDVVEAAHEFVASIDDESLRALFAFIPSIANGKTTIVLAPDGSKKGWVTAKAGDALRKQFIDFLESYKYDDGSSPIDWVEVGYGEFGQKVLRGNCQNCYGDAEYAES